MRTVDVCLPLTNLQISFKKLAENLRGTEKMRNFALAIQKWGAKATNKYRGVEQLVARQAHNLEVTCSSRVSATKQKGCKDYFLIPLFRIRSSFALCSGDRAWLSCIHDPVSPVFLNFQASVVFCFGVEPQIILLIYKVCFSIEPRFCK